ncbi:MAG: TonB-dependent receptor [Pelagibacteraceae bacterium TMED267]|nr:MAG: TonB-dependent receptor [Pelagibacteraceae bacterium TMED267]
MKKIILNLLFFTIPSIIFSQSFNVKILDRIDGSPIDNLRIESEENTFLTDENGSIIIDEKLIPIELNINDFRYYSKKVKINQSKDLKIELTHKGFILDDIVINSNFYSKKLKDNNTSTSIIDDIEFRKNEGEFLINSLNQLTGIYSHSAGYNTNRITIRGMGSRSPYSTNKIKSYLNNIPLSNGVGETTIEDFGIEILDQIEINKGPNSSTYGSGLGGNIVLKTSKSFEKTVKIKSIFKSFNTYQNSISVSKKINKINLLLNFEKIKSDGFRDNNTYDNNRIFASVNYEINDDYVIDFIHFYNSAEALIPSSLSLESFIDNPSSAAFSWRNVEGGEDYNRSLTGLTFNSKKNKYTSSTTFFYKTFNNDENRPFNYLIEDSDSFGFRHIGKFPLNSFDFSYGLEYSGENYIFSTWDEYGSMDQSIISQQTQDRKNYNYFLQVDKSFKNSFLTFGIGSNKINYDWVDETESTSLNYNTKTIISPRLSYNHNLDNISIFGNISHGFSSPNIDETLDENGIVNPDIKPETGWNYELGLIGSTNDNSLSYNLNLYYMDIKNLLVAQRTSFDTFTGVNAGRTTHPGLEATINFPLLRSQNLTITSSSNFSKYWYIFKDFNNRGTDYSQNKLTGVPTHTTFSKIKFDLKNYLAQISFQNVGKIPMNDSNELFTDSYSVIDLKLSKLYSLKNLGINISTGVNNLFDKRYASGIVINARGFGGRDPRFYYPGLPRNYFISLSLSI